MSSPAATTAAATATSTGCGNRVPGHHRAAELGRACSPVWPGGLAGANPPRAGWPEVVRADPVGVRADPADAWADPAAARAGLAGARRGLAAGRAGLAGAPPG